MNTMADLMLQRENSRCKLKRFVFKFIYFALELEIGNVDNSGKLHAHQERNKSSHEWPGEFQR